MVKKLSPLIIVIIFACISNLSLLHQGFPPSHDGEYHVIRFYEFDKVLRSGTIYPRWAPDLNNGYGVPLFNYVYPLPNYVSSFLHFFGISFINAYKLNLFIAGIIGAAFFYLWSRDYWGNLGGVVSSIFYTFSPYHILDVYVRGSVGEVWALGLLPAFLYFFTKLKQTDKNIFIVLPSMTLALMIFSHNILALMFFIFSLTYIVLLSLQVENKKRYLLKSIIVLMLGLGLSSVFWIPALMENKYVTGLQIYSVQDNFPDLFQLIIPSWGTGFSEGSLNNQMSLQIGAMNLLVILLSIPYLIILIKKRDKYINLIFFFLIWFFLLFFLILKVSLPIWEKVPFMDYFQFPWRLLSLEILVASFLAGSFFMFYNLIRVLRYQAIYIATGIVMVVLSLILTIDYTKPAYYHYRDDNHYISRSNFIDGTNSPGDYFNTIWIKNKPDKSDSMFANTKNITIRTSIKNRPAGFEYIINAHSDKTVIFNQAYFPGWQVKIDNKNTQTSPSKEGLISFKIPKGEHNVKIIFADTPVRKNATLLSLLSFIIIIGIGLLNNKVCYRRYIKNCCVIINK